MWADIFKRLWAKRGYRTCPDHPYMPRRARVGANAKTNAKRYRIYRDLEERGRRYIRAAWEKDANRKGTWVSSTKGERSWVETPARVSRGRNVASLTSRLRAWEVICWWGRLQAERARVRVLPSIELPAKLLAEQLGGVEGKTACAETVRECLRDLVRWGVLVVESGQAMRPTVVGVRLITSWYGRQARAAWEAQRTTDLYRGVSWLLFNSSPHPRQSKGRRESKLLQALQDVVGGKAQGVLPGMPGPATARDLRFQARRAGGDCEGNRYRREPTREFQLHVADCTPSIDVETRSRLDLWRARSDTS